MVKRAFAWIFTGILLGIVLLFPTLSLLGEEQSKKYYFNALVVCGGSVDCGRATRIFETAAHYLDGAVDVRLNIRKIIIFQRDFQSFTPDERLTTWRQFIQERERQRYDLTILYLDPFPTLVPYVDFKVENALGVSSDIGGLGKKSNAFTFVKLIGSDLFATRVTIHELGHLLGAEHNMAGIMFPSMDVAQYSEGYSLESIQQIREYLHGLP